MTAPRPTLRCVDAYYMWLPGDRITGERPTSISEDGLNFYWHDVNYDDGFSKTNFMTLPKYAFVKVAA